MVPVLMWVPAQSDLNAFGVDLSKLVMTLKSLRLTFPAPEPPVPATLEV
jgi:hypothetical protein